jgi:hypothetical protein
MSLRRSLLVTAALAVVAFPLAACGSSGSPSGATGATKRFDALAFSQCMRTHGVPNFPDLGSNGSVGFEVQRRVGSGSSMTVNGVSVSAPAFQSAMQSCRKDLPNGGHPPPLSASRRAAMLRFSQCMRTHGITNFPDPTFGANGGARIGFGPSSGINPQSPAFQNAQKACASASGGGIGFKVAGPPPSG